MASYDNRNWFTSRNILTRADLGEYLAPCCKKFYKCRVCHDENETHDETYVIDRKAVELIKCSMCDLVQNVRNICESCNVVFGKYFCEKCRLYDDEDKGQFHCDECGLCSALRRSPAVIVQCV
ncbi:hypothetical protein DPMN_081671 [Dreissena polymorpha]|uniref:Uncharacterized protein n=1 Tax=Dreissena polymorpha TaxID=45954 RepID=A0A9D3Y7Q7_DREPO|nr:hypothetical protein DPMN_081671 [Dreissena polymorpha]